MIEFVEVESSNVKAIAKDGDDLLVKFNSGAVYRYTGASKEYQPMLDAESKGKFFNANVKEKYAFEKETK